MDVTKLGIGTPTKGLMEARTAFHLATAMQFVDLPMQLFLGLGCYIQDNRNMIVDDALKNGCSHLLQVDTDMAFDHTAIQRLIASGKDIVGARYNKRILPIESTVKDNITELSSVKFVPAGLLLVNCEVFRKIGMPYFWRTEETPSDDEYFCNKAIAAGYQVWCDPTIQVGHYGTAVF